MLIYFLLVKCLDKIDEETEFTQWLYKQNDKKHEYLKDAADISKQIDDRIHRSFVMQSVFLAFYYEHV